MPTKEHPRRAERIIEFHGRRQNLKQWAKEMRLGTRTLTVRLNSPDWTVERALTERPYGRSELQPITFAEIIAGFRVIPLAKGHITVVDSSDVDAVAGAKWHRSNHGYTAGAIKRNGRWKLERLHRLLMGAKRSQLVDHVNGIKWDNRRSNLRFATYAQNACNRKPGKNNTSGVKGVCWDKQCNKWRAHIAVGGVFRTLGWFSEKADAVAAREAAARELHGEFARLD